MASICRTCRLWRQFRGRRFRWARAATIVGSNAGQTSVCEPRAPPLPPFLAMPQKRRRARDLERTYSPRQFAAKLRRLAKAVEHKRPFTIRVAGETLRIPSDAEFNVEHERAGGLDELEFQLRWRRKR